MAPFSHTVYMTAGTACWTTALITARSELRKVPFLALSVTFCLCESDISGTAGLICAKFTGKTCWSLARMSLNVKVKTQGHQGQKRAVHSHHPRQRTNGPFCCMTHCNALATNNVTQQQTDHSVADGGDFGCLRAVYKSLALY